MTISLTRLFTRIGLIAGGLLDLDAIRGGTATARVLGTASYDTRRTSLFTDFATAPVDNEIIAPYAADIQSWKDAQSGLFSRSRALAEATLIEMANDDVKLPGKTVTEALKLLINQMTNSTDDVNASSLAVGAQAALTGVTNVGSNKFLVSPYDGDGKLLEYCPTEVIKFVCTSDATNPQGGTGATEGYEPWDVSGQNIVGTDSELWPRGSGISKRMNGFDPEYDNQYGNLLYNSDFETYSTTNLPDDWVIATGTVTTHVAKDAAVYRTGGDGLASISFIGDAATLIAIQQSFNTAHSTTASIGGTPAKLKSRTPYAVGFWTKVSNNAATGVLAVSLVDGSGNVINDDFGTANTISVTVDNETTSWAFQSGFFRLPSAIPSTVKIRLKMTTALSAHTLYIDDLAMAECTQLATGGPWAAIYSDPTDQAIKGDSYTVTVTQTFGAFQKAFERLFGMRALGLKLPSDTAGGETISDSLVT